ncbi:efflux RND transporter permease subunit [PVC group bacterium]|nr:efflux RND transporter permease subunit [PVC group bacterium]
MLKALIRFSLNYSSLIVLVSLLLTGYAAYRIPNMSIDVFPELNAPTVVVMAEAGGLAADEVEQYVTFPIESAVNGMTGVRRVRSTSAIGLSIVWVDLDWGADLYDARQLVAERLSTVRENIPSGVDPFITPITSIAGEIMLISLSSPSGNASPLELRSYAEFDLRNKILAIPGVAQVVAIGGELPEYQVNVDQEQLRIYGLTISDVVEAAANAHSTASAGYLPNVGSFEIPIRQQSRVTKPSNIANTIIAFHDGVPVTIGQVANVRLGPALKRGEGSDNGSPAVVISIQKSPGTNTLSLTQQIDTLLDQVEKTLPVGMVLNRGVFRQAHFINRAVSNVITVLFEAVVIVAIVLMLFLMNIRTTIITLTALPVSLAIGLLMMDAMNLGLNVMSLGGLTVAIGVLVDDAIIDVENVFRRLKQNNALQSEQQRQFVEIIFDASNEIRPAMVFATVIIVLVFVPLLFLQGLEGKFFQPLAITYMISIIASLVVALTLTPALCKILLGGSIGKGHDKDSWLVRVLKRYYTRVLHATLNFRGVVIGGATAATVGALLLASTFGTSFLPSFNEGTFTVFLFAPPGTSLIESNRLATNVETQLAAIEGVHSVSRRTGRAERDEHAEPVSSSEIEVSIEENATKRNVHDEISKVLAAIPGITTMVGQPIEHRLSHLLSGTPAAIAISIYGEDLHKLRSVAKKIESALTNIPGARDVNANREVMITSLPIRYRHAELASFGLTPAEAAQQVREAMYGEVVDTVNQGTRQYDLVVRLDPTQRETIEQVRDLLLRGRNGATVRLRDVADIGPQRSSNLITRENAQRKAVVSLNVGEDSNLGDLIEGVRLLVDPIVQKAGYTVHYGGQFEAQQSATKTILASGFAVAILILMLLQISTGSMRAALLVMVNMPLALIGGIAAIYITEGGGFFSNTIALFGLGENYIPPVISIASMVGFITLFGISIRNGILLINHYNYLMSSESVNFDEAIFRGSMERLVPILMTALAAALGLAPLALAAGKPGSELLAPLAIVTLGGLLTSTLLNLIVVPAGFSLVFRKSYTPS